MFWQYTVTLFSICNSFACGLGDGHNFLMLFWKGRGGQTFVTKCNKRVCGQFYAKIV